MLTDFSLWLIYSASYLLDYIVILILAILKRYNEYVDSKEKISFLKYLSIRDYIVFCCIGFLIIISIFCAKKINHIQMNTRQKEIIEKNVTIDTIQYIIPQGFTILTLIFSDYWLLFSACIFFLAGIIFVRSKRVLYAPIFVWPLRYSLYQANDCVIITNYTRDSYRLALQESPEGLQARELEPGIFLMRKEK